MFVYQRAGTSDNDMSLPLSVKTRKERVVVAMTKELLVVLVTAGWGSHWGVTKHCNRHATSMSTGGLSAATMQDQA